MTNNHQGCRVCAWPWRHSRCGVSWQCLLMSLHSVDPDSFYSDNYVHSPGENCRSLTAEAAKHWFGHLYCRLDYCNSLLYGVTDNAMRTVQSLQNAAARLIITGARRRDHITPVLCQLHGLPVRRLVEFKLAYVWCARHCAVKCLSTWLMTSISSPKAIDDPFGLPLITCARCHVHTTALETEALALSAHEFGTVCRAAYWHLTSATNILRRCWRHVFRQGHGALWHSI